MSSSCNSVSRVEEAFSDIIVPLSLSIFAVDEIALAVDSESQKKEKD